MSRLRGSSEFARLKDVHTRLWLRILKTEEKLAQIADSHLSADERDVRLFNWSEQGDAFPRSLSGIEDTLSQCIENAKGGAA